MRIESALILNESPDSVLSEASFLERDGLSHVAPDVQYRSAAESALTIAWA